MNTLTVKLSESLDEDLARFSERENLTKSELVRRALVSYLAQRERRPAFVSALQEAGDLAGCFSGGPADLASNPRHMDEFGKT